MRQVGPLWGPNRGFTGLMPGQRCRHLGSRSIRATSCPGSTFKGIKPVNVLHLKCLVYLTIAISYWTLYLHHPDTGVYATIAYCYILVGATEANRPKH